MYDPQVPDFHGRLARIERMHRRGYGFEAPGTIGRSRYPRRARRAGPLLRPLILVAAVVLAVKAVILSQVGAVDYNDRLARVSDSSVVERTAAFVMQIDPLTAWLGEELRKTLAGQG